MKIGMYVHFCHTKRYSQKKLKNLPKLQTLENGLNFQYARKNPLFDQKTCPARGNFFLDKKKGIKFEKYVFFNFWSKYFEKCIFWAFFLEGKI